MLDTRQLVVTGSFLLLCLSVFVISLSTQVDRSLFGKGERERDEVKQTESIFKDVNYYVYKDNAKSLHLDASKLVLNNIGQTLFTNPEGVYYAKSNLVFNYKAKSGALWQGQDKLSFEQEVEVNTGETWAKADEVTLFFEDERVEALGNVATRTISSNNGDKLLVNSDKLIAWFAKQESHYLGRVRGKLTRKKIYEQGMEFTSNNLRFYGDQLKAEMEGNVFIKKQDFQANSNKGEIFLKNYNKKLKYFVLYDDVKVIEKVKVGKKLIKRKAFAEKLEGIMSKDKYVLTGYPRVFQDGDVIKGYRIILRENNEVVEVDDSNINFILR